MFTLWSLWLQAIAIQREIVDIESELQSLRLRLEKVQSESAAARTLEEQIKAKRERLVELRCSQKSAMEPDDVALSRDQLEVRRAVLCCDAVIASRGADAGACVRGALRPQMVFDYYANYGRSGSMTHQKSLDSFMFMKFCRECPDLVDSYVELQSWQRVAVYCSPRSVTVCRTTCA